MNSNKPYIKSVKFMEVWTPQVPKFGTGKRQHFKMYTEVPKSEKK